MITNTSFFIVRIFNKEYVLTFAKGYGLKVKKNLALTSIIFDIKYRNMPLKTIIQ